MSPSSQLRLSLSIVSHAAALLAVVVPLIVLHSGIRPVSRVFFCTDESLSYPYKQDTVSFPLAVGAGIGVTLVTILVVEALRLLGGQPGCRGPLTDCLERRLSERTAGYVSALMQAFFAAKFGALCTELVTQASKLGFGRPRPYFLAACQLLNASACRPGLPLDPLEACGAATAAAKVLDEARLSFPSGHSSFCIFVATFLALYLHARLAFSHPMHALKNVCQLSLLVLGGYVCMSRVSDYHHHWSDILAGGFIGAFFGFLMSLKFASGLSVYRPQRLVVSDGSATSYELVGSTGTPEPVGKTADFP